MSRTHRSTIFVEQAPIVAHRTFAADQHVLRLAAPRIARDARPGAFVHVRCGEALEMRRPMSILSADPASGEIEVLFKVVGRGTALLARQTGDISLLGPIGRVFDPPADRRPLLIGGGVGIPPILFLAHRLRHGPAPPFVAMGSEVPFPLETGESGSAIPGIDPRVNACARQLESAGIESRLASRQGYPGCFPGHVTELAELWLEGLGAASRRVAVFACGPTAMLKAVTVLAAGHGLPCQISLEEYMACAVGGCAGCAVRVRVDGVDAMRRVCVDGPVFEASQVVFD